MEFGVNFPQTEIGTDPEAIREYARTAEELGFQHLVTYDHILGVEPPEENWDGAYDYTDQFHEPMALFGHLSAITDDLTFMTGIMVLPQRQTALVAKQITEIDILSQGRVRLGVGVGWNGREYASLGKDFRTRGKRIEEQVDVLRNLWQNELVDYDGEWHEINAAGINPLPVERSIPLWMGGGADVVLRRIARIADGWIAPRYSLEEYEEKIETLRGYLEANDRNPDSFPIHARLNVGRYGHDELVDRIEALADLGVSHLAFGTHGNDFQSPAVHIEKIREAREAIDAVER